MAFKKGHKLAPGGARAGAGRPSDETRELFGKLLTDTNAWVTAGKILRRDDLEQFVNDQGEQVKGPAPLRVWVDLFKFCVERWAGKTVQVDIGGSLDLAGLAGLFAVNAKERGLND